MNVQFRMVKTSGSKIIQSKELTIILKEINGV
jgi:hypothetical protein